MRSQRRRRSRPLSSDGQIRHDVAIYAVRGAVGCQLLDAVREHRVDVAHQDQRNLDTLVAEPLRHLEGLAQRDAVGQRHLAGALDGGAVREWIGKGNADLQEVRAAAHNGQRHVFGDFRCRVAGGDEGNNGRAALGARLCEGGDRARRARGGRR